jgi:hypothetical protein
LDDSDFDRFLEEERQYLKGLKEPRQHDNEMEILYVEALENLEAAEYVTLILSQILLTFLFLRKALDAADHAFRNRDHIILTMDPGPGLRKALAGLTRNVTLARTKWSGRLQDVARIEEMLDIHQGSRWDKNNPKRLAVVTFLNHKDYNKALDELERLVVMRLLELTKLNQSELGKIVFH